MKQEKPTSDWGKRVRPSLHIDHRRANLRLEVLGAMSASLLSTETFRVVNLSAAGALVEGTMALPLNAEYQMQLVLQSHVSAVTVKVRRVIALGDVPGPVRYRLGLEFLAASAEANEAINHIVLSSQAEDWEPTS